MRKAAGFTLIELLVIIAIIGVLSVAVAVKTLDINSWRLRTYFDRVQTATMFANRVAVAQRRAVQVTYGPTGATVQYLNGAAMSLPNVASLDCPTPNCLSTGSVTFYSPPDGLTQTSAAGPLVVTVASGNFARSFTVDQDTGYVHQ